jgi:predicted CXXCH cytochrome family protein
VSALARFFTSSMALIGTLRLPFSFRTALTFVLAGFALLFSAAPAVAAEIDDGGARLPLSSEQEDFTAPTLVSVSPADGAQNVPVVEIVTLQFSEPLDDDTLREGGVTLQGPDGAVTARLSLDDGGALVRLYPELWLDISTEYRVVVSSEVSDLAGNLLGRQYVSSFTTSGVGTSPHGGYSPTSSSCRACHVVHGAVEKGAFGIPLGRAESQAEFCYTCHDGTGADTDIAADFVQNVSGHQIEDSLEAGGAGLTATCSSCHGPHFDRATTPNLYRPKINGHEVTGDDHTWCQACHDDASSWSPDYPYPGGGISPNKPVRDPANGYPILGTFAGASVYNRSANAHGPESQNVVWPDSGRSSGDCRNCHAAHGSESTYDALLAQYRPTPKDADEATVMADRQNGTYAELCLTCHDADGPATTDIKQFVTYDYDKTGLPEYTGGHRIATAGGNLPVGAPLPCYNCHNPHGSKGNDGTRPNKGLVSDEQWSGIDTNTTAGVVEFCTKCHLPYEYVRGSGHPEADTIPPGQLTAIEGLDRRVAENRLSLPDVVDAHGKANMESPSESCYTCHGNSYEPPSENTGFNVHRPDGDGYDPTKHAASLGSEYIEIFNDHDYVPGSYGVVVACASCHSPDLGASHAKNCRTCHPTPRDSFNQWTQSCQQGGCHTTYHDDIIDAHWDTDAPGSDCNLCHRPDWSVPPSSCGNCHAILGGLDVTPPVTSSNALSSYIGPARIKFSVTDGGKIAAATTFYRLDGGALRTGSTVFVTEPGAHVLEFWSVDQAGNVEGPPKQVAFGITPDTIPPVTTSNAQSDYYAAATILLTATDNGTLGVKETFYTLNGGAVQTGTRVPIPASTSGTVSYTLRFWSEDWSGNVEAANTVTFDVIGGTGTIRLVWGDSDVTPLTDPNAAARWTVRRGGQAGTIVATGSASMPGWSGVNDVVVPVSPTAYHVVVEWWDAYGGYWDESWFPEVFVIAPDQVVRLSY